MRTVNRLTQLNLSERLGRLNHCYLVGCLILLGLLLRLPFLRLGLFRDEGSTYFDALPTTAGEVVRTVILCELNPLGFFLIMHQWMRWFGSQEIIFKLPALIFGLLLIAATYGLGRVVGSRTTALLAALFATLAPAAVYYSQEARPGYRQFALVTFAVEKDSQTEQLLTKLKLKYPMLLTKDYSGAEPVTLHLFSWGYTQ